MFPRSCSPPRCHCCFPFRAGRGRSPRDLYSQLGQPQGTLSNSHHTGNESPAVHQETPPLPCPLPVSFALHPGEAQTPPRHSIIEGFPRGAPSPPAQQWPAAPRPPRTLHLPAVPVRETTPRPRTAASPASSSSGSRGPGTRHSPRPLQDRGDTATPCSFYLLIFDSSHIYVIFNIL